MNPLWVLCFYILQPFTSVFSLAVLEQVPRGICDWKVETYQKMNMLPAMLPGVTQALISTKFIIDYFAQNFSPSQVWPCQNLYNCIALKMQATIALTEQLPCFVGSQIK